MPDICDLVLDDHEQFRRRFAELDEKRAGDATDADLAAVWGPLAAMLERHASAEESLLYPRLLKKGENAEDETDDAVSDHNKIRNALDKAAKQAPGSEEWWRWVLEARAQNSDHIAEEEREALPDFRLNADPQARQELGANWLRYSDEHAGAAGLDTSQKDVDKYIARHS